VHKLQNKQMPSVYKRKMKTYSPRVVLTLLAAALVLSSGCGVYFNTFFNAKKAFSMAERTRGNSPTGVGGQNDYRRAIEKCLIVTRDYPNSKYYDDALYILAVSYYHVGQYSNAEKRFRELLANHAESEYTRDVPVYLAKTKLALGDIEDAMLIFEDILEQDQDKTFKAEAAVALGEYYHENEEYDRSRPFLLAVRDSLGDDTQVRVAQIMIADGYFDEFNFQNALGAYLQVLGTDPDKDDRYHSLFQAANCSYRLQRIEDGFDYLAQLSEDDIYYDSLGILQLTVAEGYEYMDDLLQAEAMYDEVANTTTRKMWESEAYYRLGLIYQFDYDILDQAKEFYDKAATAYRGSDAGQDALQRSADIGKLEVFARNPLDSGATQDIIDNAAYTQYLLSELFWFRLDKPDTAMFEMQYLVDSFPLSYIAPKALVALAHMYRDHKQEDHTADSLLKLAITEYPNSDYYPEAISALGLSGTVVDTGYAELYVRRAEEFLLNGEQTDSARANYQYVVDHYPDSKYNLSARFAVLWLTEKYHSPGDSSLIFGYQALADSFPGTMWASEAVKRLSDVPVAEAKGEDERDQEEFDQEEDPEEPGSDFTDYEYADPLIALYYHEGDSLADIRLQPIEVIEPFEFPTEAVGSQQYDWQLYFQILIDYSGKVIDYSLKIPSGMPEIDERASITVGSMTFDAIEVSNRLVDAGLSETGAEEYWFVYMYRVIMPEHLRR